VTGAYREVSASVASTLAHRCGGSRGLAAKPRTPFPFHPPATLDGHLLLRLLHLPCFAVRNPRIPHEPAAPSPARCQAINRWQPRRTTKTTLLWGRRPPLFATTRKVRNELLRKSHGKLRTAGSPHPGEHQTTILGRSSDSPSSSSGAFPCEVHHTVARHRSRLAYSSGGCAGMSAPVMRRFTGFPFHPAL
jgi:hypothetical protein